MCKKQVRLFSCHYMINDNENEVENEVVAVRLR